MTVARYKKHVWKFFSMAIRLRDADNTGFCQCISSGSRHYYIKDNMQAGHFLLSRMYPNTRWNFKNVSAQSAYANGTLAGDQYRHGINLNAKYGYDVCSELFTLGEQPLKENIQYLDEVKRQCIEIIIANAKQKNLWDWKLLFTKKELKEMGL